MPSEIAYSTFNLAFSSQATIHPYQTLDQMLDTIIHLIGQDQEPSFIHAYWPEFDRLSHTYGVASYQVHRHFDLIDAELTRFEQNLAGDQYICDSYRRSRLSRL